MISLHLARQVADNPIVRWIAALMWTVLVIYLMVWPSRGTPVGWLSLLFGGTELTDAIGHVILIGILVGWWYHALRGALRPVFALSIAVAIGLGLGIVTELAQSFVPSRGASLLDVLADGLGVILAGMVIGVRHRRRSVHYSSSSAPLNM